MPLAFFSGAIPLPFLSRVVVASLCALSAGTTAALPQSKPGTERSDLAVPYLESQQAMVEARKDIPPETRTKLANLYQRAIADVERARLTREETGRLREALRAAPLERRRLDRLLEAERKTAGDAGAVPDVATLKDDDLEHLEVAARAEYDEAQLQVDRLEAERDLAVNRPYTLAQEQEDARKALDRLRTEPAALAGMDTSGAQGQAQQLATRARIMALQAELERLAAESAYLPAEQRILELERDLARARLHRAEARAKLLLQAAMSRQRADADRALTQAARSDSLPGPVRELAVENAKLKGQLVEPVVEQTLLEISALRAQAAEIDARSDAIRRATADRTLRSEFVEALLDRLHSLPTAETFARQRQTRNKLAAATFESNLRNTRLLAQVSDLDVATALAVQATGLPEAEAAAMQPAIRQQLAAKREALMRLDEQEKALLRSLREAAEAEQAVLARSAQARDEAIRLLVWIPLDPLGANSLVNLRLALEWALSPGNWRSTGELLVNEATARPVLTAVWALLVVLLYALRGTFVRQLAALAPAAVAVEHYRIGHTLAALIYTALLALPGALTLWGAGVGLEHAPTASPFSQSLGFALRNIGTTFFAMYGFSWLFDARGVAVKHFLWPAEAMQTVKRAIRLFMLIYVPAVFVALMNSAIYAPHVNRESLGRIAFICGMVALSLFVWRVFRRSGPVMHALLPETSRSWPARLYPLWANALIALPIALGVAAAAGFYFAAGILYRLTMATLVLVLAAVVVYGMIALWVLIQRARLSRRQAAQVEERAVQVVSEEGTTLRPLTLDVYTLGERTSHLLNLVTTLLLLAGVWAIWRDWVPFLSAIGDVSLWTYSDVVQGELVTRALTIRGLVLAALTLTLTYVASVNIGAVLDIVVLQRLELQRDITYGIKTVLRYAIAVVGLVVASNILGVSWSKAQWLVAALGVGLGFGLQEIVANFVSGLIVLGERPIRVGDVVTVADITGTVTSIRARATVVTDFENKEVMIPNKAFITERVINWTLSNQTTRLLIKVGLAYGTDVERAQRLMLAAVQSIPDVLRDPAPSVFFVDFGDSALDFEIRAFVEILDKRLPVRHAIHVAVARALTEAGIEIPFPQRDLHIRSADGLERFLARTGGSAT
jgi:potassium-dependent mechanosensitive channel